jgi:thiazole synthase ThiGH ThiG subunit
MYYRILSTWLAATSGFLVWSALAHSSDTDVSAVAFGGAVTAGIMALLIAVFDAKSV